MLKLPAEVLILACLTAGGHWVIVTRIHNDWYLAHTLEVVACSSGASSIRPGVFATDGPVDAKLLQVNQSYIKVRDVNQCSCVAHKTLT